MSAQFMAPAAGPSTRRPYGRVTHFLIIYAISHSKSKISEFLANTRKADPLHFQLRYEVSNVIDGLS
jgi:hypothetical protein